MSGDVNDLGSNCLQRLSAIIILLVLAKSYTGETKVHLTEVHYLNPDSELLLDSLAYSEILVYINKYKAGFWDPGDSDEMQQLCCISSGSSLFA